MCTFTKFTKSDLKTGHIVETRCGERYLILKDCTIPDCIKFKGIEGNIMVACEQHKYSGWMPLQEYTDDLMCKSYDFNEAEYDALPWLTEEIDRQLDIIAVYQAGVPSNWHGIDDPQHTFGKPVLIWKRTKEVIKPAKSCETCCHSSVCIRFGDINRCEYQNDELYYAEIADKAGSCEHYSKFCE